MAKEQRSRQQPRSDSNQKTKYKNKEKYNNNNKDKTFVKTKAAGKRQQPAITVSRSIHGLPVTNIGLNQLKKNIRSSARALKLPTLGATKRQEQERQLQANLAQLEGRTLMEVERKHMQRYKRVRFFERRKAERKWTKAESRGKDGDGAESESEEEVEENPESALQEAEADLYYTLYFPRTIKYISLYADTAAAAGPGNQNEEDSEGEEAPTEMHASASKERSREIRTLIYRFLSTRHPDTAREFMSRKRSKKESLASLDAADATKDSDDPSSGKPAYFDQVTAHLLAQLPWLAQEQAQRLVQHNPKVYEMLGKSVDQVRKEKIQQWQTLQDALGTDDGTSGKEAIVTKQSGVQEGQEEEEEEADEFFLE